MNKDTHRNVLTLANLQNILRLIKQNDTIAGNPKDGYTSGKQAILELFKRTKDKNRSHLRARLGLIDASYSTQMNRRYFGLDDLTDAILSLNEDGRLKERFKKFALSDAPDPNCFALGKKETLWSKTYGIGKEGEDKGAAIALISKFAYFWTGFRFPIYDSIACDVIPKIVKVLLGKPPKLQVKIENRRIDGDKTIVAYVKAINQLRRLLGKGADFDTLDRLLWYTGKMMRGNFSLILSKADYVKWSKVWRRKASQHRIPENLWFKQKDKGGRIADSIKYINSSELPFLNKPGNKHVKMMYELAKALSTVSQKCK